MIEIKDFLGLVPWIVGGTSALVISQFLLSMDKWAKDIPWQIRAYGRFLLLALFMYLLQLLVLVYIPEQKVKIFLDGVALSGDLIKTLVGAIIGALSMAISKDKDMDGKDDNIETPSEPVDPLTPVSNEILEEMKTAKK